MCVRVCVWKNTKKPKEKKRRCACGMGVCCVVLWGEKETMGQLLKTWTPFLGTIWPSMGQEKSRKRTFFPTHYFCVSPVIYRRHEFPRCHYGWVGQCCSLNVMRSPAYRENISDAVELCETQLCFLHIQFTGTFFFLGETFGHMRCRCSDSLNERLDGRALAFMKLLKRRLWKHERSHR